ncbi:hypothetical protein [Peterkaempfera griseoplana]|uniref:hypothetical protein n=1 Tax=Peterkaempfera griseoplana TaxID=66896 RepID=UPI0006E2A48A|nr:hypothetical protein [Peterkaempfera griseoplana]
MTGCHPGRTGDPGGAASHPRNEAELLSEVSTDGALAISRVLRDAEQGDETAARMRVSALLRALPGVGLLTAHELLRLTGIREAQQVRDLEPSQLGALLQIISRFTGAAHRAGD